MGEGEGLRTPCSRKPNGHEGWGRAWSLVLPTNKERTAWLLAPKPDLVLTLPRAFLSEPLTISGEVSVSSSVKWN